MRPKHNIIFILAICMYLFSSFGETNNTIMISRNDPEQDTIKKPTVYLEEAMVDSMTVLCIKDTAPTSNDISKIIGAGYGEIFTYINQSGLEARKVMAFYETFSPPFIMKLAVEVNRTPDRLTGRIKVDIVPGGNAIIARYKGPYENVAIAYTAIAEWLKQHQKEPKNAPFEVYLNDPATVKDSYELRTDVYQFIK